MGTAGVRELVETARQNLDAALALLTDEAAKKILAVPYLSQWGIGADVRRGDCGPACIAMLARFLTSYCPTVDEAAAACGQPVTEPGALSTGHKELRQGAAAYGIKLATRSQYCPPLLDLSLLKAQIDQGFPSVAVIHYGVLRDYTNAMPGVITNQDQKYSRGHWVLFIGYGKGMVVFQDSDFWQPRTLDGQARAVPEVVFQKALEAVAPGCTVGNQGLVVI